MSYFKNTTNKKNKENNAEKAYALANRYNNLLHKIEKMEDAKEYVQIRNLVNAYASEDGAPEWTVQKLNEKLKEKVENVLTEIQNKTNDLNAKITELKADHLQESSDVLQELQTKSDNELLQLLMRLRTDEVYNKRFMGSYLANASREQALAVCKLSQMEQYKNLLSAKQKELALEKSQSKAVKIYEEHKQEQIEELNKQLSQLYMQAYSFRLVLKKISNSERQYYWN